MLFPSCQVDLHRPSGSRLKQIRQYPWHPGGLVAGGAAHMGSYVARIISQSGTEVQVVDNNSTGLDSRVLGLPGTNLELSDPGATEVLEQLMNTHKVTAAVNLATLEQAKTLYRSQGEFHRILGKLSQHSQTTKARVFLDGRERSYRKSRKCVAGPKRLGSPNNHKRSSTTTQAKFLSSRNVNNVSFL